MRIRQFVVSLFIILYALPDYTYAQSVAQDSLALVEFYNANNGNIEWELDKWLTGAPLHEWQGLTVSGDSTVTRLVVNSKPILSLIHLGQLHYLREVNFRGNWLTFPEDDSLYFSAEFTGLANIERLIWSRSFFMDDLGLNEIFKLQKLKYLDLSVRRNREIPFPKKISQLKKLVELNLFACRLTGFLPEEVGDMKKLELLNLDGNSLLGAIPEKLSQLENLKTLNIGRNEFNSLPYVASVTDLNVSGTNLTFSSLVPYAGIPRLTHLGMGKIDTLKTIYFDSDTSLTLNALSDVEGLQFTWYQNGLLLLHSSSSNSELKFENPTPENSGVYYYEVSHPALPGLKLISLHTLLIANQMGSYYFSTDSLFFEDNNFPSFSIYNAGEGTIIIDKITTEKHFGWGGELEINYDNQPCIAANCNHSFAFFDDWLEVSETIGFAVVPPNSNLELRFHKPDLCPICKTANQDGYFEDTLSVFFKNPETPPFKIFASGQGSPSSVSSGNQAFIESFDLSQNYPNPFNPETTIKFNISHAGFVKLEIFNILGELVEELLAEEIQAGEYSAVWNGKNDSGHSVSSGVYIYKLQAGSFVASQKMILLR